MMRFIIEKFIGFSTQIEFFSVSLPSLNRMSHFWGNSTDIIASLFKSLQINLAFQDVVGSEVKYSYGYEFFNNTRTCSHIEIIIKSCK